MTPSQRWDGSAGQASHSLSRHASELYDDARLMPMLRQLIRTSCGLGGAMGGSVSLVDGQAGRYTKVAEYGTACRLGQSFPLDEGVTGQVLNRRGPVVLESYRQLTSGHLKVGHPAAEGAVVAVPIWWRADIVAVNVVFAGMARSFSVEEVDDLELVTQVVAPGLITAVDRELPDRSRARPRGPSEPPIAAPAADDTVASVNDIVAGLIELTHRASGLDSSAGSALEMKILGDDAQPRLLFRPDAHHRAPESPWQELVDEGDAVLAVPSAEFASEPMTASPLTAREQEVVALLAQGHSYRSIAAELFLSPKTVEKHVAAILRKTRGSTATAAVVTCLQRGWL